MSNKSPNLCGQLGICENTDPCAPNPKCDFKINQMTKLIYDNCYDSNNESAGDYQISNFHSCKCGAPVQQEIALENPTMTFRDGYGWTGLNGCKVDIDSFLRVGQLTPHSYKPCNPVYTNTYNNNFIPLNCHLAKQVQNTEHLIQTDVCSDWVRGGIPSRQLNKTVAYIEHCNQYIHNVAAKQGMPMAAPQYFSEYTKNCKKNSS